MASFSIETKDSINLEVFEVTKNGDTFTDIKGPALVIDNTYGPDITCQEGQYFVIKVYPRS